MKIIDEKILGHEIEKSIKEDIENGRVGGAAVCVWQSGKELYRNYFSNIAGGFDVKEDTIFRMASMTKPITAVAVLILVDRGLISLDDKVSDYIKGFEEMPLGRVENAEVISVGKAQNPITVRHLLSHTSGLISGPVGEKMLAKFPVAERVSLEKVVDYYTNCPLDFDPFTQQAYSGVAAFDVLARVVEIVSGKSYSVFLAEEIFEPLGMKDTTFAPDDEQWSRMIPMHDRADEKSVIADFPKGSIFGGFPTSYTCGGAGLASTLGDYLKFAKMLYNRGEANGKRIISEQAFDEMIKPQVSQEIMPGSEQWGLSVRVITSENNLLPVGAFGWSGAYGTHFWIDPETHVIAVYMKNSLYDGGSGAVTARDLEKNVKTAMNA